MKRISWVLLLIFCILFLQLSIIQAQTFNKKITINWMENHTEVISDDITLECLRFSGAVYTIDFPSIPYYTEQFPIAAFYKDYDITLTDAIYEDLNAHDIALLPVNFHPTTLPIEVVSNRERQNIFATLSICPILETSAGHYRRLISANISIQGKNPQMDTKATHRSHSILASGQWFRFTLTQSGVYKITYDDLIKMGVSSPINSSSLAIFGNGGGMLPESNSIERIDDIQEIPIDIHDGNDGILDASDYILFYGQSPHVWYYDTLFGQFNHTVNVYADSSCYFLTTSPGVGEKKRIQISDNHTLAENKTVNTYTHYAFYEDDSHNLAESGREWFGDLFDATTTRNYGFQVPGFRSEEARMTIAAAGTSTVASAFSVRVNGNSIGNMDLTRIFSSQLATINKSTLTFVPPSNALSVQLIYNKPTASSSAYLDWIEIEVPCNLSMHSPQVDFRNPATVEHGAISKFIIQGATSSTQVWDVTEPGSTKRMALAAESNGQSFKAETSTLRQFIAFDGTSYLAITPGGRVQNQDLHATEGVDMIIVTHPKFLAQANRLAEFRNNHGVSTKVVTIQQIYNEFSSGIQDPLAIRDYMKLIYDKTNRQYPKYLLLVGRPSYDYRGRVQGTELFVPNYQFAINLNITNSISETSLLANDATFGLLDDNEGLYGNGIYDIAVGRFPCSTVAQATTAVDKSILYTEHRDLSSTHSSQISNFGDWRNIMAFVADDEQSNDFITNADAFTRMIENANPNINFDKMYLDAYQQVSNAGGQRYPDVTTGINNRMNRGALFFTYIGHSGKDGWANERILENSDINKWTNKYNLPVMLTLSCTFAYYDRPAVSPAELAFFNSKGGVSALITTTREAWSGPNNSFGNMLFQNFFNKSFGDGRYPTIGELETYAKNKVYGNKATSLSMFVVFGDPSMPFAIPSYRIVTDSINHVAVGVQNDTILALSKMTVSGHVEDADGQPLPNFNGTLYPSVYDKKVTSTTLVNDPESYPFNFDVQKNILFKGNSSIVDGKFTFSFYVPRDIDYSYGNGKISYYGCSENNDGAGAFSNFIIGGTDTNSIEDHEGPVIEIFMNDESFIDGGITTPNPTLIAKIRDNYGINTTGNGIGHDLVAIIDNATESQIVLNDYYQTDRDSFNSGVVRYNLNELASGTHTIRIRAWDINNNHSESDLRFEVVNDEQLTLRHVLNYPNPFTTQTDFYFEQNYNGGVFDIQVQIYTISGKLVKTINTTQNIEGNRSKPIHWDGLDDFGDKIGKGVYMYKLRVKDEHNRTAEVIEKLVIL